MANELQGRPAAPDAKAWLDYVVKLKQDAPGRYEDAAKFLAGIISLTITILFTAYDRLGVLMPMPYIMFVLLLVWLAALLCAFWVMFPKSYGVSGREVEKIKAMQEQIIRFKKRAFGWAVWLYVVPLAVLVFLYLLYLLNL